MGFRRHPAALGNLQHPGECDETLRIASRPRGLPDLPRPAEEFRPSWRAAAGRSPLFFCPRSASPPNPFGTKLALAAFLRGTTRDKGQHNEQGHVGRARLPRFRRLRHTNANRRNYGGRGGRSRRGRAGRRGRGRGSGRGGDCSWRATWRRILSPSLPLDRSVRLRSHAQLVPVAPSKIREQRANAKIRPFATSASTSN